MSGEAPKLLILPVGIFLPRLVSDLLIALIGLHVILSDCVVILVTFKHSIITVIVYLVILFAYLSPSSIQLLL